MRICVTGAAGKVGEAVVVHLREHGHDVTAVDLDGYQEFIDPGIVQADLADPMQALEALEGHDAVVHAGNIPADGLAGATKIFTDNTLANFNVLHGAVKLGLRRVVWMSSETTLGLPFGEHPPDYLPVDEAHYPRSTTTYAMSKVVTEAMAVELARWSGIPMIALRLSNVYRADEYAKQLPGVWDDIGARDFNGWSYIDVRDVAEASRLALEADVDGTESLIVAAPDTIMRHPTAELVAERWPDVEVREPLDGHRSLLSSTHTRAVLGWAPERSWRDELDH